MDSIADGTPELIVLVDDLGDASLAKIVTATQYSGEFALGVEKLVTDTAAEMISVVGLDLLHLA